MLKEVLIKSIKEILLAEAKSSTPLVREVIRVLNNSNLDVKSITISNKSDTAIVVRCEEKKDINSIRNSIVKLLKSKGYKTHNEIVARFDASSKSTRITKNDNSAFIVYKYATNSSTGLAFEHIVSMLLTGKITDELKDRIGLQDGADKNSIFEKLKTEYIDVLKIAIAGKRLIENKIGKVTSAQSEGSRNSKADLIVTTDAGEKYGISIKLVTEEGRELRFTYNKNLGRGDDPDSLISNPSGKPWWYVARKVFAKKLGRSYSGTTEDVETPNWMEKAKENKNDLYKEAIEQVYESMRIAFVNNLRKLKLSDLVKMVNEAHLGPDKERKQYKKLYVLISDADGLRLIEQGNEKVDIKKIRDARLKKSDIVKIDGAKIIIDIPGISELVIHGVKFHMSPLASSLEGVMVKTR